MITLIREVSPEPCTDKCPSEPHPHKVLEQEYVYSHHVEDADGNLLGYVSIPTSALKALYGEAWLKRDFQRMRQINADKKYGHEGYIDLWELP